VKTHRKSWRLSVALFLFSACCLACSGSDNGEQKATVPSACDMTTTPIVFAHGFLEDGDAFANQSMRFISNGYCQDRTFAFDWNTLGGTSQELERLKVFIDQVLAETGSSQVDLIGHSMGTFLSMRYLSDPTNAAKVAHYANLAGAGASAEPGGVPTIAISSEGDHVAGLSEITGAVNVHPPGLDHLQVATSAETFKEIYTFFNDGAGPVTQEIEPTEDVILSGRLLTFAENQPAANVEMRIYAVDPTTGSRLTAAPVATVVSDADGHWGPFNAVPGQQYEYEIISKEPHSRPLHYYREPFPRSCNLVYFRVFPPPLSVPGLILGLLPYDDSYTLLATLTANQAVESGRDTLFVDGLEISSPEVTPPEQTVIAIFYFDSNHNGATDGPTQGGLVKGSPFIQVFDLSISTSTQRTVPLEFNGRMNSARNWKSDSEGLTIVVFE
jgi:pimeloyl-ACP methyl ester carboxylesterase